MTVDSDVMQRSTTGDLPPVNTTRWVRRRKAAVVVAVGAGLPSLEDACGRNNLTSEEYTAWKLASEEFGPAGLMTTKRKIGRSDQSAAAAKQRRRGIAL